MSTSTESSNAAADQTRQLTERSAEVWRNGAKTFADQLNAASLPAAELTQAVARYFEFLQMAVDVNRDLATRWAELFTTVSGSTREQVRQVSGTAKDQVDTMVDRTGAWAEQLAQASGEKAEQVNREQDRDDDEGERAGEARAHADQRIERDDDRNAQQEAREAYQGWTKAELSDELADRDLPKSGTIEELIERLVSADSE